MEYFHDIFQLNESLHGVLKFKNTGKIEFVVPRMLQGPLTDRLVFTSSFGGNDQLRKTSRRIIHCAARVHGIYPTSLANLYNKIRTQKTREFMVPVFNIRGMTFSTARAVFRVAQKLNTQLFVFSLSPEEMDFTDQSFQEYIVSILGAAMRECYRGPVFFQIDGLRVFSAENPLPRGIDVSLTAGFIKESIQSGFYHFNLDDFMPDSAAGCTNDYSQRLGHTMGWLRLIHEHRATAPVVIGLAVPSSHPGTVPSKEDVNLLSQTIFSDPAIRGTVPSIYKTKPASGVIHRSAGPEGIPDRIEIDLEASAGFYLSSREHFNAAGIELQTAADLNTLPMAPLASAGYLEIKTGDFLQDFFFDHPLFPSGIREELHAFIETEYRSERDPGLSDDAFYYGFRGRIWRQFKKSLWNLDTYTKTAIVTDMETMLGEIMARMHIANTRKLTEKYCSSCPLEYTIPDDHVFT